MGNAISHEEYLRRTLDSKKMELENEQVKHMVALAQHHLAVDMLRSQINSIEKQLDSHKNPIL